MKNIVGNLKEMALWNHCFNTLIPQVRAANQVALANWLERIFEKSFGLEELPEESGESSRVSSLLMLTAGLAPYMERLAEMPIISEATIRAIGDQHFQGSTFTARAYSEVRREANTVSWKMTRDPGVLMDSLQMWTRSRNWNGSRAARNATTLCLSIGKMERAEHAKRAEIAKKEAKNTPGRPASE